MLPVVMDMPFFVFLANILRAGSGDNNMASREPSKYPNRLGIYHRRCEWTSFIQQDAHSTCYGLYRITDTSTLFTTLSSLTGQANL